MRLYLQHTAEPTLRPKFYQICLDPDLFEGWLLVKEWGFQGSPGRIKKEHYSHQSDAEEALIEARDNQLKRGYRIVFVQGATPP